MAGEASGLFQLERVVQRLDGKFHVLAVDQDRDLDLGRGDDLDVDVLGRKGGLRCACSVAVDSPGYEDGQDAVTAFDRFGHHCTVVSAPGENADAVAPAGQLVTTFGPSDSLDLVATVKRVADQVLAKLAGYPKDADALHGADAGQYRKAAAC